MLVGFGHSSVAQVRVEKQAGQSAPAGSRVGQTQSTDSSTVGHRGLTSRLRLVPSTDVRPVTLPFPFQGLGWDSFDFFPFWSWTMGAPVPVFISDTPAIAPTEGAPNGGLQLDVQPWRAQVYVDGVLAGVVEDFRGYYRHLDLVAGPHLIGIVAPDYRPLIIEVMVSPGHTSTFRGTLTRHYN